MLAGKNIFRSQNYQKSMVLADSLLVFIFSYPTLGMPPAPNKRYFKICNSSLYLHRYS